MLISVPVPSPGVLFPRRQPSFCFSSALLSLFLLPPVSVQSWIRPPSLPAAFFRLCLGFLFLRAVRISVLSPLRLSHPFLPGRSGNSPCRPGFPCSLCFFRLHPFSWICVVQGGGGCSAFFSALFTFSVNTSAIHAASPIIRPADRSQPPVITHPEIPSAITSLALIFIRIISHERRCYKK